MLKGIITHLNSNMVQVYDEKLDEIETKIKEIEAKEIAVCKEFSSKEFLGIHEKVKELYCSIFVGNKKEVTFNRR